MKLSVLAAALKGTLFGRPDIDVKTVVSLLDKRPGDLTFILEKKFEKYVFDTPAKAVVTFKKLDIPQPQIVVKNPRKALLTVLPLLMPEKRHVTGVCDTAKIADTASVGRDVGIGSFVTVQAHTTIDDGTQVMAHVTIGEGCRIGKRCKLYPNVTLLDKVSLGDDVVVFSGAVIGSDGFGYYQEKGAYTKIPHIGGVVIENDVEIGANTSIDRGCIGDTHIGQGAKIDNLVHIAHNVTIGKNCAITAGVCIAGGVILEDQVSIGGNASVVPHITVHEQSVIVGCSGVTKDVPARTVVSGYPADNHGKQLKKDAIINRWVKESIEKKEKKVQNEKRERPHANTTSN